MKTLTVFTPSFNRAHLLPRLYQSLQQQTSNDFIWLIIDDGSGDNTKEIVDQWINENKIDIQYYYKENGGMHTGHNAAYKLINTELNVCIDSDDYMPNDAVDKILKIWDNISDKTNIAGIIGLDAYIDNSIVGTKIPEHLIKGNLYDLYNRHQVTGDKKLVIRTDVVRAYPNYPEFKNEKLVPLGILYMMIGNDYDFIYTNEVLCIVDYQPDGSSGTIFRQYKQSPRGFAYAKTEGKRFSNNLILLCKNSIQIVSSAIFAKDFSLLNKGTKVYLNYLMLPFGLAYYLYVKYKIRQSYKA